VLLLAPTHTVFPFLTTARTVQSAICGAVAAMKALRTVAKIRCGFIWFVNRLVKEVTQRISVVGLSGLSD